MTRYVQGPAEPVYLVESPGGGVPQVGGTVTVASPLPIVLSEWAIEGRSQEGTAAAMEPALRELQDALGGRVWIAFWFSWNYTGYEMTDVRRDGAFTPVGERWLEMVSD